MIINNPNGMPKARKQGPDGIFWPKMHCDTLMKKAFTFNSDSLFLGYCKDTEQNVGYSSHIHTKKCRVEQKVFRRFARTKSATHAKPKRCLTSSTASNTEVLQITCHSKQVWWILNNAFRRTRRWRIWSIIRSTTIFKDSAPDQMFSHCNQRLRELACYGDI